MSSRPSLICGICDKDTTSYAKVFADSRKNCSTTAQDAHANLRAILGGSFPGEMLVVCIKDMRNLAALLKKIKEVISFDIP